MGKRSEFRRRKNDAYFTPPAAVLPLLPYVAAGARFAEPCAGNGALIDALTSHGLRCTEAYDIEPKRGDIIKRDFFSPVGGMFSESDTDIIITNPPWTRQILHPMIDSFAAMRPTWLLFDADWMHTKQAEPYLQFCHKIVSVGRVSWMGNGVSGMDNSAWYLFDKSFDADTQFVGRAA